MLADHAQQQPLPLPQERMSEIAQRHGYIPAKVDSELRKAPRYVYRIEGITPKQRDSGAPQKTAVGVKVMIVRLRSG